jgi:multidrug resistance efflux pump
MKRKSSIKVITLTMTLATLLLAGCSAIPEFSKSTATPIPVVTQESGVVSQGKLIPTQYVNLSFNTGGLVAEVLVKEGDTVQKDQPIAHLDQREQYASAVAKAELDLLNAQQTLNTLNDNANVATSAAAKKVADARAAVRDAQQRLDNLNSGSPQTDINSAQASVTILKNTLDQAQKDFNAYEDKPEDNLKRAVLLSKLSDAQKKYDNAARLLNNLQGSANQIDISVAEATLSLAQAQLDLAQQNYDKVQSGPNPDDLAAAQARVKATQAALSAAQAAYDDLELKAPFSGTISQLNMKVGEMVAPGQPAAVLGDFSGWVVETTDLTEIDVPKIKVGDAVKVTFDALPGLELGGVVDSIGQIDVQKSGDTTYTTRIKLTESDPQLRWGMTAVVHIQE